ncbi:MAG: Flp pilus assembly complex ATPase component TadA [gamma proteobacterium symbiont of Bathyaustriella thionipta]|nr:Flp pilus assembly complex ATPase component TadA [gamma proteobacterium symbiont of Bathyaustriella thionipta]MCU7954648.1 Flp pilus assembly complex ATPase component TadA [gamma proteobacterium symbiont of Bathyaustriella thionipta]MCU7957442.1 Flp pilus assembly complex ATPase component TadA [gamma proteobacterium symbiont of Bathyaustriella thionipta]MCU7966098.1 Flp pilus assembly complex ATPase component TadA [gamma proteobacterium symbiont of Bathyaustriella thionipta]
MSNSIGLWEKEPKSNLNQNIFDDFLMWCFKVGASDIFVSSDECLAVMYHDEVVNVGKRPIRTHEIENVLKDIDIQASFSLIQGGKPRDFQYVVQQELNPDSAARFRVSATGEKSGVEIVLRAIPSVPPTCSDLNVENEIVDGSKSEYGLVLITGPTGSGKSTLNAALLGDIAINFSKHIITYESPIEFDLKAIKNKKSRISQTSVPDHVEDYPSAISNALRRKPQVILIGEARDKNTIEGCITASQTGHLVYSTVHTNSVGMTIPRMVDVFPPGERKAITIKLVDAMRLIINQRLVKRKGGGLCAIKSFLVFTKNIRQFLLTKVSNNEGADVGRLITALVSKYGQPLLDDVELKYDAELIDDATYNALIAELGSGEDLIELDLGE